MHKKEQNLLESINIITGDRKSVSKLLNIFAQLKKDGFEEINVRIEASLKKNLIDSGYNLRSFNKIKTLQDLPEKTVYDLMDSCGKLKGSGIDERIFKKN
jgi:hypothetical protein